MLHRLMESGLRPPARSRTASSSAPSSSSPPPASKSCAASSPRPPPSPTSCQEADPRALQFPRRSAPSPNPSRNSTKPPPSASNSSAKCATSPGAENHSPPTSSATTASFARSPAKSLHPRRPLQNQRHGPRQALPIRPGDAGRTESRANRRMNPCLSLDVECWMLSVGCSAFNPPFCVSPPAPRR